jgi:hypothetical protein
MRGPDMLGPLPYPFEVRAGMTCACEGDPASSMRCVVMRFPKSWVAQVDVRQTYTHNHRCRHLAEDVSTRHGHRFESTTDAAVPQLWHGHVSGRHHRAHRRCCGITRLRMSALLRWVDAIATGHAKERRGCGLQRFALIGRRGPRSIRWHAARHGSSGRRAL